MNAQPDPLVYPYDNPPAFGTTMEVAAGVYWLQMPLPMSLNHINLYLLEGEKGWTVVDTGIRGPETRDLWQEIFDNALQGKPVDQVLCTHMHPDHTGQAGFISEYWHAPSNPALSVYPYHAPTFKVCYSVERSGTELASPPGCALGFVLAAD